MSLELFKEKFREWYGSIEIDLLIGCLEIQNGVETIERKLSHISIGDQSEES